MPELRIEQVAGRAGLRRFLEMPAHLYADDPNWVPPLILERLQHLDPGRNPFLRGIDIAWFLAFRDDRCVGRISAQTNAKHLERYADATGHFGFIEGENDPEVFAALVGAAEAWLRQRGMRRMAGPFNPSINDECGLLVEGFDKPPSMMMGHARPWYGPRLEEQGLAKARDLICYDFDVAADLPPAANRIIERLGRNPDLRVRPLDMRRYEEEIRTVCAIFNDAWAGNWGFIPFGEDEARYLAKAIRPIVDANYFAIGEYRGEPASMVVTLPNINEAIADLGGRLLPFGWAKLLWRLKVRGVESGRMPLMGVRREHQGTARGAALALGVIARVRDYHRARGRRRAELSWVLEDNEPMHQMIRLVGAHAYKTYRLYQKELA
ncbi:dATP pyrophosphohydrolase [Geminicoccaceae bacterium 1502E]|nr:dATP pyrophosphohydrolase [Geminicoccaceae bacterium 1502E]